jgi:hypothetical protein
VARVVVPGLDGYPFHAHYMPGDRALAFAARAEAGDDGTASMDTHLDGPV